MVFFSILQLLYIKIRSKSCVGSSTFFLELWQESKQLVQEIRCMIEWSRSVKYAPLWPPNGPHNLFSTSSKGPSTILAVLLKPRCSCHGRWEDIAQASTAIARKQNLHESRLNPVPCSKKRKSLTRRILSLWIWSYQQWHDNQNQLYI